MTSPESILAVFAELTGQTPRLMVHQPALLDFIAHGFTAEDMRVVLLHIQRQNRRMSGAKFSLRLDRLLDYEYRHFDGLLSEAQAQNRNRPKPPTPREQVLAQLRPQVTTDTGTGTAKSITDVMRTLR
jgi:hypothetical protein